jgi:hypothetical protein
VCNFHSTVSHFFLQMNLFHFSYSPEVNSAVLLHQGLGIRTPTFLPINPRNNNDFLYVHIVCSFFVIRSVSSFSNKLIQYLRRFFPFYNYI